MPIVSYSKRIIQRLFNNIGLDIVRSSKNPLRSFLGLKNLPIKTIIDVGANTGQFAKKISSDFPQAYIYSFEPILEPFETLKKWADKQNGRVKVFNIALGDRDGQIEMFSHINHTPSSSTLKTTRLCEGLYPFTRKQTSVSVNLTTLNKFIANLSESLPRDILIKLDVQGYEDRVIRGGTEIFRKASACISEISLDQLYEGQATFKDILLVFYHLGYKYAGNIEQKYAYDGHVISIDALFVNATVL